MFVFMKYNERFHFRILIPYLVPAVMAQEECFSQGPKSFMERIERNHGCTKYQVSYQHLVPNQYIYRLPLQALEVCGVCDA